MNRKIKDDIQEFYHLNEALEIKGGPEEDSVLFEELIEKQEGILAYFGLPPAQKYISKLWQITTLPLTDQSINETIGHLQSEAEQHLLSPVSTPTDLLLRAREEKASSFNILPELGYITHDYFIFIYEEIFLKGKATPEQFLAELETVERLNCYADLFHLKNSPKYGLDKLQVFEQLEEQLTFLSDYLHQAPPEETSHINDLGTNPFLDSRNSNNEPDTILFKQPFELKEIVYSFDSLISLFGQFQEGDQVKQATLGVDRPTLEKLLQGYTQGAEVLENLVEPEEPQNEEEDEPVIIDFPTLTGNTLMLTNHYLLVYPPDFQAEEESPDFYVVSEVLDKHLFDLQEKLETRLAYLAEVYTDFQNLISEGLSDSQARQKAGLADPQLFELAKLCYQVKQAGGDINLTY